MGKSNLVEDTTFKYADLLIKQADIEQLLDGLIEKEFITYDKTK